MLNHRGVVVCVSFCNDFCVFLTEFLLRIRVFDSLINLIDSMNWRTDCDVISQVFSKSFKYCNTSDLWDRGFSFCPDYSLRNSL